MSGDELSQSAQGTPDDSGWEKMDLCQEAASAITGPSCNPPWRPSQPGQSSPLHSKPISRHISPMLVTTPSLPETE